MKKDILIVKNHIVGIPYDFELNIDNLNDFEKYSLAKKDGVIYNTLEDFLSALNNDTISTDYFQFANITLVENLTDELITFAKKRSEDSKGTNYEWDFDKFYPTEEDIEYFISIIESCPFYNIRNKHQWDDLFDWFENNKI